MVVPESHLSLMNWKELDERSVWEESYEAIKTLREIRTDLDFLTLDEEGYPELKRWCDEQQIIFAEGKLSKDLQEKLESIQFPLIGDSVMAADLERADSPTEAGRTPIARFSESVTALTYSTMEHWKRTYSCAPTVSKVGSKKAKRRRRHEGSASKSGTKATRKSEDSMNQKRSRKKKTKSKDSREHAGGEKPLTVSPSVYTKIRRRFTMPLGWFNGFVSKQQSDSRLVVVYPGTNETECISGAEAKVGRLAYELKNTTQEVPRPRPGTKIRKQYGDVETWFDGKVVSQSEKTSLVVFTDGAEEYLSDDELNVCAAAYSLHYERCADLATLLGSWEGSPSRASVQHQEEDEEQHSSVGAPSFRRYKGIGKLRQSDSLGQERDVALSDKTPGGDHPLNPRPKQDCPDYDCNLQASHSSCRQHLLEHAITLSSQGSKESKNEIPQEREVAMGPGAERPAIGVNMRDEGRCKVEIINVDEDKADAALVRYSDGQEEWMSEAEVEDFDVDSLHQFSTPQTGTKVRQRFHQVWFDGEIVSRQGKGKLAAKVLCEDEEEGHTTCTTRDDLLKRQPQQK